MPIYNPAVTTTGNGYLPSDYGYIAWSFDIGEIANSTVLPTAGLTNTVRLKLPVAATITNIVMQLSSAPVALTSGQCFAGIYPAQGGTLIGATADLGAATWTTVGNKVMPLVGGPFAVSAGDLIVAFYANWGTTGPSFMRGAGSVTGANAGLTAPNARVGTADSGRTTSLAGTLGTLTLPATANTWWCAVS